MFSHESLLLFKMRVFHLKRLVASYPVTEHHWESAAPPSLQLSTPQEIRYLHKLMGCPQAFSRPNSPSSQTLLACQVPQSHHHLCNPNQTCSSVSTFLILGNPKLHCTPDTILLELHRGKGSPPSICQQCSAGCCWPSSPPHACCCSQSNWHPPALSQVLFCQAAF